MHTSRYLVPFALYAMLASCSQPSGTEQSIATPDTAKAAAPEQATAPIAVATPFSQEVSLGNIKFAVSSPGTASGNNFTITPSGLTASNEPFSQAIEGLISSIEIGDIDADASPELLVVTKAGADMKATAYLFSVNNKKSMSMVNLPDISGDTKRMAGYQGHDECALVEGTYARRFPIYENGQPTGKTRQLQYKLKPGEAMKQLVLDKTIEF